MLVKICHFHVFWCKKAEKGRKSKKLVAKFGNQTFFFELAPKCWSNILFPEKHIFSGKNIQTLFCLFQMKRENKCKSCFIFKILLMIMECRFLLMGNTVEMAGGDINIMWIWEGTGASSFSNPFLSYLSETPNLL